MGNETLFRDKPVWNAIFTMAVPAVLTILIMVIYNMADMFFVAMLGDDAQVAAIAVVGPVFSLATAAATMLGAGGSAVIAKALGAQEYDKVRACGSLCIWSSLLFGGVFGAVMLAASETVLGFFGATEDILGYAKTYMQALSLGAPLMIFSVVMATVVRAEGAVIPGMLSNMAGTVTNLLLDPLFILIFGMGVTGAAIATVLGNLVACAMLARFIIKKSAVLKFSPQYAQNQLPLLLHTLALGLPNGLSSILSGFASTFSNQLLSGYGSGAIAAMAAANRSTLVITMVQMGICMGVSPLMAYNYGAKNLPRLREILLKTGVLTVGFGFAAAAACFVGRDALLGMFLQTAEFRQMGNQLMFWLLLASPLLGVYYLSSNFLQAAGNAVHATVVSVLRQGALLIPSLYLMHRYIGLNGIAAAHTVSDLSAIVVSFALCFRQYLIFMRSMKKQ